MGLGMPSAHGRAIDEARHRLDELSAGKGRGLSLIIGTRPATRRAQTILRPQPFRRFCTCYGVYRATWRSVGCRTK